jgi:hypothetical protein
MSSCLFLFICVAVAAVDVFVSPSGNDSADGLTSATPVRTSLPVLAVLRQPQTLLRLHFGAGTFSGDECYWPIGTVAAPHIAVEVEGNGTVFACPSLHANASALMSVSASNTIDVRGIEWTQLFAVCPAGRCAALLLSSPALLRLDRLRVTNCSFFVTHFGADADERMAAPVVAHGATIVDVANSVFANNSLELGLPSVGVSGNRLIAVGSAALAVNDTFSVLLQNVTFHANAVRSMSSNVTTGGAAMLVKSYANSLVNVTVLVAECLIDANRVESSGGAVGGAVLVTASSSSVRVSFADSTISFQELRSHGNALSGPFILAGAAVAGFQHDDLDTPLRFSVSISQCSLSFNVIESPVQLARVIGGLVLCGTLTLQDSTLHSNQVSAVTVSGGLLMAFRSMTISNCSITQTNVTIPAHRVSADFNGSLAFLSLSDSDCHTAMSWNVSRLVVSGSFVQPGAALSGQPALFLADATQCRFAVLAIDAADFDNNYAVISEGACLRWGLWRFAFFSVC